MPNAAVRILREQHTIALNARNTQRVRIQQMERQMDDEQQKLDVLEGNLKNILKSINTLEKAEQRELAENRDA